MTKFASVIINVMSVKINYPINYILDTLLMLSQAVSQISRTQSTFILVVKTFQRTIFQRQNARFRIEVDVIVFCSTF